MIRSRKIYPIGAAAVLIAVTVTGCPNRQRPVDTSQTILVEAAAAMADVDRAVAAASTDSEDAAIDAAVARVEAGECAEGEDREDCVVRFLREGRAAWYAAATAIDAARAVLETWEAANDAWRDSGERPDDWGETVCRPFETAVDGVIEGLENVGITVPATWRTLLERADDVCRVGVQIAEALAPEEGGDQ
jgi:flagellin-like protein